MLHHLSIAVKNPAKVASVLGNLLQGKTFPFPPLPDSYIVIVEDEHGTAIEISPLGLEFIPGETEFDSQHNSLPSNFTATHVAISVPISQSEIEAIAEQENWLCRYCDRGVFDVIELWIENHLLFELITPEMNSRYLNFMSDAENFSNFIATAVG